MDTLEEAAAATGLPSSDKKGVGVNMVDGYSEAMILS